MQGEGGVLPCVPWLLLQNLSWWPLLDSQTFPETPLSPDCLFCQIGQHLPRHFLNRMRFSEDTLSPYLGPSQLISTLPPPPFPPSPSLSATRSPRHQDQESCIWSSALGQKETETGRWKGLYMHIHAPSSRQWHQALYR